jgi:hypothetical protein
MEEAIAATASGVMTEVHVVEDVLSVAGSLIGHPQYANVGRRQSRAVPTVTPRDHRGMIRSTRW